MEHVHYPTPSSAAMNKMARMLEAEMNMDQVLKGFMVDLEIHMPGWTCA